MKNEDYRFQSDGHVGLLIRKDIMNLNAICSIPVKDKIIFYNINYADVVHGPSGFI